MGEHFQFEELLQLDQLSTENQSFINRNRPWKYVGLHNLAPGCFSMAQCLLAAYKTVPEEFVAHHLHAQFTHAADVDSPFLYRVQCLATTKSFISRVVTMEQNGMVCLIASLNFTRERKVTDGYSTLNNNGLPAHTCQPASPSFATDANRDINPILDDFTTLPKSLISRERLGIFFPTTNSHPSTRIYKAKLSIKSPLSNITAQILAVLYLSDQGPLEAPQEIYGMKWGLPVPGDLSRTLTVPEMAMTTTLNHAIWFRRIEGFDATDGLYMESQTSWISGGKALCRSNIFDKAGELIATTEQEGYFIPKRKQAEDKIPHNPGRKKGKL